jgi:hypothetical protein
VATAPTGCSARWKRAFQSVKIEYFEATDTLYIEFLGFRKGQPPRRFS